MKGGRAFLAVAAVFCLMHHVSAAPMIKVKMAETYVKTAEGGGFTAKTAAKEARQRIDALKKEFGEDDPDVQALEKRLLVVEGKEKAAQDEKRANAQAEREKQDAEKKAAAPKAQAPVIGIGHKAPRPWVLDTDYEAGNNDNPIKKYAKNLGKEKKEDVLELDKQLRARIAEDRQIVNANGAGEEEAQKEIDRYEDFLSALARLVNINSDIRIDVEKKKMDFYYFKVFFSNFSRDVKFNKKDGKYYFFGDNGEPEYIREKEIPYAKEAFNCMYYINVFFANQGNNDHYMQIQSKAAVCANYTNQALKNNSPDVVIFHPINEFPKGALHNALAKEALPLALPKLPNAVDVIINSNDWGIERNQLGIIIRRVCAGWVVIKDDLGKRVIPAKWFQPNQGGDTYGKLQLLNYGGNRRYYVK